VPEMLLNGQPLATTHLNASEDFRRHKSPYFNKGR